MDVYRSVGIRICSDYPVLVKALEKEELTQSIPENLQKKPEETHPQWRDRLYHQFRLQCIISALSDLKLSYVEQISPLLSREILDSVRQQPDELRTGKAVFRSIVNKFKPKYKFATKASIASAAGLLKSKDFSIYLKSEIQTSLSSGIFNEIFLNEILNNINYSESKITNTEKVTFIGLSKKIIKKILPSSIYKFSKKNINISKRIDYNKVAFRIILIIKMRKILKP
jgi:hypothetical protein